MYTNKCLHKDYNHNKKNIRNIEVSKKLIYLCTETPTQTEYEFEYKKHNINNNKNNDIEKKIVKVMINTCFTYAITIKNNTNYKIKLISLVDPLLTVSNYSKWTQNKNHTSDNCFIHFKSPSVSVSAKLNPYFRDTGEIISKDTNGIEIDKKSTVIFTISGMINCKKLTLQNIVYLKYKDNYQHNHSITITGKPLDLINNYYSSIETLSPGSNNNNFNYHKEGEIDQDTYFS